MALGVGVRKEWHGRRVLEQIREAEVKGLELAAEHLLAKSVEIVPLDEGPLMHSGVASVDASERKAAVSFDKQYAVRQHEELDYNHAPGRQAKYLEGPWLAERETMLAIIAAQIREKTAE